MDFFQAQENARRTSRWLVWWFMGCVLGVVISIYVLAVVGMGFYGGSRGFRWIDPGLFAGVAVVIGGLIVAGSLFKLAKLSGGGAVVARDLGGREIDRMTTDFHERRLLNVVEEMAIAAGVPVPGVWVMDDEPGINAFAAGSDPANAVVGVTRGALQHFDRDELQGVIAHEFSHILNGDMRLNMRLTGWVFGLLMVAILGRIVLQSIRFSGTRRSRDGGKGVLLILAVGASIWLVGTIGSFFGRCLQAAVSRQREYLADASAVQFTRNPSGIVNALRKLGNGWRGSSVQAAAAAEARHLFFARSDLMGFGMATHPPLEKRIRAIFPQWDGTMLESEPAEAAAPEARPTAKASAGFPGMPPPLPGMPGEVPGHAILGPVLGALMAAQADGRPALQSKDDAIALVHGLLLPDDEALRQSALAILTSRADAAMAWHGVLRSQSSAAKLAQVDQVLPWLKQMTRDEAADFIATNRALIEADGEVSLFEFMLEQVLDRNVAIATGLRPVSPMRHRSLDSIERELAVLIHVFATVGGEGEPDAAAREEYREHTGRELPRLENGESAFAGLADALRELDATTPLVKSRIMRMCRLVAEADGTLADAETELLRAVADAIGAPMPRASIVA